MSVLGVHEPFVEDYYVYHRHEKRRGHAGIVLGSFGELWIFWDFGRLIRLRRSNEAYRTGNVGRSVGR